MTATSFHLTRSSPALSLGLVVALGVLLAVVIVSVLYGAADIGAATVWVALFSYGGSTEHLIIRTLRVPRALVAVLVGGSLAVAGAVMQGVTRNPMADPGLLGIEAGAALAVVAAVHFQGISSLAVYTWFALAGAALAAVVVYALGSAGRGGITPLKLTVSGAALTALLSSLTTGILLLDRRTLDEVCFWLAGSVAGRDLGLMLQALPLICVGLLGALLLGRKVTTLSLGEDVARGLGQRTAWVRAAAALVVVLLAGGAVALAGPVGFVGLVIPHAVRFFVGVNYRWILPYSALAGAIFLVLADVAGRLILRPQELPVGVMTALVGGPFFVYLVRWKVRR